MHSHSVIIPSVGRSSLWSALASIACQTQLPAEVIVVSQSEDTSLHLRSLVNCFPLPLKVIDSSPVPPSVARNEAASQACGSRLLFLDDDDLWYPHHIASCVQSDCFATFTASPSISFVKTGLDAFHIYQTPVFPWVGKFSYAGATSSWSIDASVFATIGGFKISLDRLEDLDLLGRYTVAYGRPVSRAEPTVLFRAHSPSHASLSRSKVRPDSFLGNSVASAYGFAALRERFISSRAYPATYDLIVALKCSVSPVNRQFAEYSRDYLERMTCIDSVQALSSLLQCL